MMYGNSSMGYAYSPDNRYVADPTNVRSQLLNASGSRQGGFWHTPACSTSKPAKTGWYDGAGRYRTD